MAKLRVYELAEQMNKTNKEILSILKDKGIEVASHMSTLSDEQIDAVLVICQSIICTTAYNNARAFIGDLLNRIKLCKKYFVADRHIYKRGCIVAERISIHNQIIQEGIGRSLIMILNHFLTKTTFLCCSGKEFLIVAFDSEILCNLFSNFTACRTKLTSNGNNRIHTHTHFLLYLITSFSVPLLYVIFNKKSTNYQIL